MSFPWKRCLYSGVEEADVECVRPASALNDGSEKEEAVLPDWDADLTSSHCCFFQIYANDC